MTKRSTPVWQWHSHFGADRVSGVEAAEIKVLSTVGMQPASTELIAQTRPSFSRGHPQTFSLTSPIVEDLANQGKVASGARSTSRGPASG